VRVAIGIGLVILTSSASALGQTDATLDDRASGLAALRRPMGIAEFGVGWLTLPGAEVCVERSQAGCEKGDTSFELEAWQLYRADLDFAFGAGATLGLITTTDAPRSDPEGIERDHGRNYFTVEMIARYYPFVGRTLEAWVGLTGGLVVVSDTFESREHMTDKALVGPRGLTIRTEGYTVGVAIGAAYALAAQWTVGATLRYGNWFLPQEPEHNVLGDEASLAGRNAMFAFGLSVAYRIPL
jgi:opacity protein-like surface antigen